MVLLQIPAVCSMIICSHSQKGFTKGPVLTHQPFWVQAENDAWFTNLASDCDSIFIAPVKA